MAGWRRWACKNLVILVQMVHEIYSTEAVRFSILARFLNVDNFRPELCSAVISVNPTDMKVLVKFVKKKTVLEIYDCLDICYERRRRLRSTDPMPKGHGVLPKNATRRFA